MQKLWLLQSPKVLKVQLSRRGLRFAGTVTNEANGQENRFVINYHDRFVWNSSDPTAICYLERVKESGFKKIINLLRTTALEGQKVRK